MNENVLVEETTNTVVSCPKCKKDVSLDTTFCPNCGKSINKKRKIKTIIIVLTVLIILFSLTGFFVYKKVYYEKSLKEQYLKEYSSNLELINYMMLANASQSEKCMNLVSKVWYNTIYEKSDSTTDKYTRYYSSYDKETDSYKDHPYDSYVYGAFVFFNSSFNVSISNLYNDVDFSKTIESIKVNNNTISDLMKKLQNPPEAYTSTYDTILELYSVYQRISNLALNPSGNLTTFNSSKNESIEEFSSLYEKIKIQIPSKK